MKKKLLTTLMVALACSCIVACGAKDNDDSADNTQVTEQSVVSDQEAADRVAAMIDAIYVQQRTADTDKQCAEAKAAWDALTEAQKLLVEGEEADYDYFGRDTGDASLDDPRNQDEIGENEILVVSFGTSFNGSRVADIKGIEDAVAKEFPDWSVRRAFTAQIIINHVQARDAEFIDNMDQALERAVNNGVKNLVVLPTHLMHGAEYDEMTEALNAYADKFESVAIAEPLLGPVGDDATVINEDKKIVAEAITEMAIKDAGYETVEQAKEDGAAFVYLGHGTWHTAKISYSQMQTQFANLGYDNIFVGTVEGEPEGTGCEEVIEAVAEAGYKKVILRPIMVVAGDHANNDMAGDDEESWKSQFVASGKFDSVDTQISGLGSIPAIQQLYVSHASAVIGGATLADGVYTVDFNTDSSMFSVNESCEGKGTLTVENGKMTLHISLLSKKILNLYPGLAEDAARDGAVLLNPTTDKVTYSDGFTEEVYGFDVPVTVIGQDFDLALIGTKGKWYDHKVSVSNPVLQGATSELKDGSYTVEANLSGGTGKAKITTPAKLTIKDGKMILTVEWSSPNYDYMIVDGEKYLPVNTEGNSVFEIPVSVIDGEIPVIADTTAMSKPHEVEYSIELKGHLTE
ncbi:MAG: sirohydrochlorin cobaltochelatase [Pseudobutyrivibrio sp.]|nr:sirohydrochlorin cobaltochelatase [Pseudobutyrivibrio sp.]